MGICLISFNKYHFKFWLPFLFLLLVLIPVFILFDVVIFAKISGVFCLISLMLALWHWKKVAKNINNKVSRISLNTNDRFYLEKTFSCYKSLNSSNKIVFENRVGLFLAEISSSDSTFVSQSDWLNLASVVVILFWDTPYKPFDSYIFIWDKNFSNENKKDGYTCIFINKDELDSILNFSLDRDIFISKKNFYSLENNTIFHTLLRSK